MGDWLRGRALARHARGHWFKSSIAHHIKNLHYNPALNYRYWKIKLEDYIFIENRNKLLLKLILSLIVGALMIILTAVGFYNNHLLEYYGMNLYFWRTKGVPYALLTWFVYHFINFIIPLFRKVISPDKIVASTKGLYISYLRQFIPWANISDIKLWSKYNITGKRIPIIIACLANKGIFPKKVPFLSSKFFLKDINAINLVLDSIDTKDKRIEMLSILNQYKSNSY